MNNAARTKICAAAMTLILACTATTARPHHRHARTHTVTIIAPRPGATAHTVNRFTQNERFAMAMAHLAKNKYLSVRQYSKMTGLKRAAAKAELEAFARDRTKPIKAVRVGKKRLYTKR